jgi:hypothetical protein
MRASCAALLFSALPALVLGQSMGDAAKKERERRDKLREAGASGRTVTDEELANNKGSLANDPKAAPAKGSDGENAKGRASPPAARTASDPRGEDYWRRRVAQARGEVERAQRRHDAFQRMIRIGQPGEYDENGRRVIYSIYQMKEMADAATAELAARQKALEDVLEDGRRSGALPGWLR